MDFSKFSIFRLPNKHKRFDYTPRYYDQEKEEREKKLKKMQADQTLGEQSSGEKRISFRNNSSLQSSRRSESMKSSLRLVLILGCLLMLVYYLFLRYQDSGAEQVINP